MRLDRFIAKSRIIDIESTTFDGALKELLMVCRLSKKQVLDKDAALQQLIDRERTMTTCLGNGIGLPHIRVTMKRPYLFAVGRCPNGLEFDGQQEYRELRLLFLLLASDNEKSYLNVLASLARILQDSLAMEQLTEAIPLKEYRARVIQVMGGTQSQFYKRENKFNRLIFREADKIARGAECVAVLVFGDTFANGLDFGDWFSSFKVVLVSPLSADVPTERRSIHAVIPTRSFSQNRMSQLRSAVLVGLTRGVFSYQDRLCCIGGVPYSNQFDTVVVVDIAREFQTMFMGQSDILPPSVLPEVMERVLAIATELSVEGREGRPVGSMFVLGDTEKVMKHTKPLVMNPFYGYKHEERNVLNPFMDETVKELSSIDGGFIIHGDGVIESAGTMLLASDHDEALPSGWGTRHAAALAISKAADCIAIAISSSTGQVTLFRSGQMLPLIDKSSGRGI